MRPSHERLIAFPQGSMRFVAAALATGFCLVFLLCYGGASLVSGYVPYRVRIDLPFEAVIPFVPEASVVYLSVIVIVGLAPFVLRRFDELFPLFVALCFQTIVAAVVFIALPVTPGYAQTVPVGPLAGIYELADLLNMQRNELPALHVAFALTSALAYQPKCGAVTATAFWLWAVAIGVSTLLMHEHHLLDLAGGTLLAVVSMRAIAPLARRPPVVARADIELMCLQELGRFTLRHPRYLVIALALYGGSVGRFAERRILRTGFCLLQSIDDILDGDRRTSREPLDVVDEIVGEIQSRRFSRRPLSRIARAYVEDLESRSGDAQRALDETLGLIRHMQLDRHRALARKLLPESALRAHHRATFEPSVNLMLFALGSSLRAEDCPGLIEALGWCSTMRDLEEDLSRGLVNIPSEVVADERIGAGSGCVAAVTARPEVRAWMRRELRRAELQLDLADAQIAAAIDHVGARVLARFSKSIRRYVSRYSRSLPSAMAPGVETMRAPR